MCNECDKCLNADGFAVRKTSAFFDVVSHVIAYGDGYATIENARVASCLNALGKAWAKIHRGVGAVSRAVVSHMNLRHKPRMPKGICVPIHFHCNGER